MIASNEADSLRRDAFGNEIAWHQFHERERKVLRDIWATLRRFARQLPFVEDLVAAYYCALDPATPMRVRGVLLAALAYFVLRSRFRPLTWILRIPGLDLTDDAAVLTAVFGQVSSHITPTHRAAAARALDKELPKKAFFRDI